MFLCKMQIGFKLIKDFFDKLVNGKTLNVSKVHAV